MTAAPRSYTAEQVAAVQRVRTCAADAHYVVLGLSDGSSVADVKKAFKGLARQLHPDKNAAPGAEEAMQRVNKAHETLSNPNSKANYDASLRGGFAAFFAQAASYAAADDFEYEEDRPKGSQGQSRKSRRKKQYSERRKAKKETERQQEEERRRRGGGARPQDFERVWTEYENEMRGRGIKVYYCATCNTVHAVPLNDDPGPEQAHMRAQQYASPSGQPHSYTSGVAPMVRLLIGSLYPGYFLYRLLAGYVNQSAALPAGICTTLALTLAVVFFKPPRHIDIIFSGCLFFSNVIGSLYTLFHLLGYVARTDEWVEARILATGFALFAWIDATISETYNPGQWWLSLEWGDSASSHVVLCLCYAGLSMLVSSLWVRVPYAVASAIATTFLGRPARRWVVLGAFAVAACAVIFKILGLVGMVLFSTLGKALLSIAVFFILLLLFVPWEKMMKDGGNSTR